MLGGRNTRCLSSRLGNLVRLAGGRDIRPLRIRGFVRPGKALLALKSIGAGSARKRVCGSCYFGFREIWRAVVVICTYGCQCQTSFSFGMKARALKT
ncbi:hypothetical protein BDW74DRAFT_147552, partial [Aspergillus multicolor]|uniref:uncharacterized protein n=1 Tax=Aspergillus multicolor TaxID=41759 RepID=UPI003CCCC145